MIWTVQSSLAYGEVTGGNLGGRRRGASTNRRPTGRAVRERPGQMAFSHRRARAMAPRIAATLVPMTSTATGPGGSRPDPTVRARVLGAFVTLVAEQGLAHTSIDDVAAAAGVSKTTLYTRWPDRKSLVADGFRFISAAIPDEPADGRGPSALFDEYLDALLDVAAEPEAQVIRRQLLAELIAAAGVDDELREVYAEAYRQWWDAAERMVVLGKEVGRIPVDRDTEVVVELLMSLVAMRHLADLPLGPPLRELVVRLLTEDRPF